MTQLAIFPPGFDGTLLVPVLIGVLVMAVFTEWWGWDFVGLVVPGYLCSVLMLAPVVAAVVLAEALAAFALARAIDLALVRGGLIFPVFGRDRFYLVLLASVAVRLATEALALPALADLAAPHWPQIAAHRNELFGIGLVLVPLTANRLWRPGWFSGLFQLGVQTALAWLIVAGLLVRWANLSIAGFELAYDHLALSFLSSPQAQIILLTTAALASQFNRRFGWDFHGILVPALLALAAGTPLKIAATVAEALVVVALAQSLLRLPRLRDLNVEGPRKVVLCFVIGFAVKLALAATLASAAPAYKPSDFFGFGYLLPSLLAERLWVRRNAALVLLPAAQTSALGLLAAAGVVVLLALIAPAPTAAQTALAPPVNQADELAARTPTPPPALRITALPARVVALAHLQQDAETDTTEPGGQDFSPRTALTTAALISGLHDDPARLAAALAPLGLAVQVAAGRPVILARGAPLVILRRGAQAVVAAVHTNEIGAAGAALWAADLLEGDVVLASPHDQGVAALLAVALHEHAALPLLVIRGANTLPGGDALLMTQPVARQLPAWLAPLADVVAARVQMSHDNGAAAAALRAFPAGGGRRAAMALLWLSAPARRALGEGSARWAARPDIQLLLAGRGITCIQTDLAAWVAAGNGSPTGTALARIEALARTRDVARLAAGFDRGQLAIVIDEGRGLAAAAVEQGGRRAAAVFGQRLESRVVAGRGDGPGFSLGAGVRTLIAGAAR